MSVCNPACQKIILNGGLVAIAARFLERIARTGSILRSAARELAEAAEALTSTHALLVKAGAIVPSIEQQADISVQQSIGWDGCREATEVWLMVRRGEDIDETLAAGRLHSLRDQVLTDLQKLVAGKL